MTKRTRASRQQAARRRPQPRPPAPGGVASRAPGGVPQPGADVDVPTDHDEAPNGSSSAVEDEAAAPAAPAAAARPTPAPGGGRRVGRIDPAAGARRLRPQQKQQATFAPLDPEDPAIPFDRVPYVPGDLRRVAVMAGLMVLLILIAAVIVTHTVGG